MPIQVFALKQSLTNSDQGVFIFFQNLASSLVIFTNDPPHFIIDLNGRRLAVVLDVAIVAAQEHLAAFALTKGQRTQFLAHPPLTNHLTSNCSRALKVI